MNFLSNITIKLNNLLLNNFSILSLKDLELINFIDYYLNVLYIQNPLLDSLVLPFGFIGLNFISHTLVKIIILTLKFISLISLLIFVRGGLPRYRYDFLTKIG